MDLREMYELFDDNNDEDLEYMNNLRTYDIRERPNHFDTCSEEQFFQRFRFTKNTVATIILPRLEHILINETLQYHEVDAMTQLLLALRFYATGSFYITVGDFSGIHKTTSGRIIRKVTQALVSLRPHYIKFPENEGERRTFQQDFYNLSKFPRVVGAIDCTHIKIQSPGGNNAEVFRNRKSYFSLNVQVVCDSKNIIMDIVARWPGSCHDSYIFQNSSINRRFDTGEFGNAVLVGDSGYALCDYLMTPLGDPQTRAEQKYNASLISTRTVVERTFGIWKRTFPVLSLGMRCELPLAQQIIIATAVLHNIARLNTDAEDLPFPDVDFDQFFEDVPVPVPQPEDDINIIQQRYINYFATID